MADTLQHGVPRPSHLVGAMQVAHETEVRQSSNGVRFATFGETGIADIDLDLILEAVPTTVTAALKANTYYFVPLALREASESAGIEADASSEDKASQSSETLTVLSSNAAAARPAMIASAYTDEFCNAAICHRNVELGHGNRGVFISTRLMGDRFALSFEFFINVAHALVDQAGIPAAFSDIVWKQALDNVRGETSVDAWEARNLTFGRPANAQPEMLRPVLRRNRSAFASFSVRQRAFANVSGSNPAESDAPVLQLNAAQESQSQHRIDEQQRGLYLESAFSDAVAIYLLSLALDFDYNELREREYPLLAPSALAARLRLIAEIFPPNPGYEFAVRYHRKA